MGALSIIEDIKKLIVEFDELIINENNNTAILNESKGVEESLAIRLDKINLELSKKKKEVSFIAIADNASNITFEGILDLTLISFDLTFKGVLFDETNFSINPENLSEIILTDWSINTGDKILLKYFANM